MLACHGPISDNRTFTPGQWVLEGLEEVEDAPADDHVVVQPDKEADLVTGWGGGGHGHCQQPRPMFYFPAWAQLPSPEGSHGTLHGRSCSPSQLVSHWPQRNSWDIKVCPLSNKHLTRSALPIRNALECFPVVF